MRWFKEYSRVVRRFAIFPITIMDETRWLEIVYLRQRYYKLSYMWGNTEFVTKEDYISYRKEKVRRNV